MPAVRDGRDNRHGRHYGIHVEAATASAYRAMLSVSRELGVRQRGLSAVRSQQPSSTNRSLVTIDPVTEPLPDRKSQPPVPSESASEIPRPLRKLAAKLQPSVPAPIVAVGQFERSGQTAKAMIAGGLGGALGALAVGAGRSKMRGTELPPYVGLALTADKVFVFSMTSIVRVKPKDLVDVWERHGLRAVVEERKLTWALSIDLADGRHYDLDAKRVGMNKANGDAVRLLTAG